MYTPTTPGTMLTGATVIVHVYSFLPCIPSRQGLINIAMPQGCSVIFLKSHFLFLKRCLPFVVFCPPDGEGRRESRFKSERKLLGWLQGKRKKEQQSNFAAWVEWFEAMLLCLAVIYFCQMSWWWGGGGDNSIDAPRYQPVSTSHSWVCVWSPYHVCSQAARFFLTLIFRTNSLPPPTNRGDVCV